MKTLNLVAFVILLLAFGLNVAEGNLGFAAIDAFFAFFNLAAYRLA